MKAEKQREMRNNFSEIYNPSHLHVAFHVGYAISTTTPFDFQLKL